MLATMLRRGVGVVRRRVAVTTLDADDLEAIEALYLVYGRPATSPLARNDPGVLARNDPPSVATRPA
jgi:hypothetical protein